MPQTLTMQYNKYKMLRFIPHSVKFIVTLHRNLPCWIKSVLCQVPFLRPDDTKPLPLREALEAQPRSPLIRRASCISFGMIVTLFAWIAHALVSSNNPIKYASEAWVDEL